MMPAENNTRKVAMTMRPKAALVTVLLLLCLWGGVLPALPQSRERSGAQPATATPQEQQPRPEPSPTPAASEQNVQTKKPTQQEANATRLETGQPPAPSPTPRRFDDSQKQKHSGEHDQRSDLQTRLKEAQDKLQHAQQKAEQADSRLKEAQDKLQQADSLRSDLQTQLQQAQQKAEQADSLLSDLQTQLQQAQQKAKLADSQLKKTWDKLQQIRVLVFLFGPLSGAILIYLSDAIIAKGRRLRFLNNAKKPFMELASDWAIPLDGDFQMFAGKLVDKVRERERGREDFRKDLCKAFKSSKESNEADLVAKASGISLRLQNAEGESERLAQEVKDLAQEFKEEAKNKDRQLGAVLSQLHSASNRADDLEAEKKRMAEALREERQRSAADMQAEQERSAARENEMRRRERELQEGTQKHEEKEQGLREWAGNEVRRAENEMRRAVQSRKDADDQWKRVSELESALKEKQAMIDDYPSLNERVESLRRNFEGASRECEEWKNKFANLRLQFGREQVRFAEATTQMRELSEKIENISQQLADSREETESLRRERDQLASRTRHLESAVGNYRQQLVLPRSSLPEFITTGALHGDGESLLTCAADPAADPELGGQARRLISSLFALEAEIAPRSDPKAIIEVLRTLGRYLYGWMEASETDPSKIHRQVERWAAVISDYCSSRRIKLKVFRVGEPINPVQMDKIGGSSASVSRIESWLVLHNDGIARKALVYA